MSANIVDGEPKKHNQISDAIGFVLNSLYKSKEKDENKELLKTIFIAKQEMLDAQCYFDNVIAPELVDHAIYKMEAARFQYVYLLKLAKDKGLSVNI